MKHLSDIDLSIKNKIELALFEKNGFQTVHDLFQQHVSDNPELKNLSLIQFLQQTLDIDNLYEYLSLKYAEAAKDTEKQTELLSFTTLISSHEWENISKKTLKDKINTIEYPDNKPIRDAMTRGYVILIASQMDNPLASLKYLVTKYYDGKEAYITVLNDLFAEENNVFSFLIRLYAAEKNVDYKIKIKNLLIELTSDTDNQITSQIKEAKSDSIPPIIYTINQVSASDDIKGLLAEIEKKLNLDKQDLYQIAKILAHQPEFENAFNFILDLLIDKQYFKKSSYLGTTYRLKDYVQLLMSAYEKIYLPNKHCCPNLNYDLLNDFFSFGDASQRRLFLQFIYNDEQVDFLIKEWKDFFSHYPNHFYTLTNSAIKSKTANLTALFDPDLVEKLSDDQREALIIALAGTPEHERIVLQLLFHTSKIKPSLLKLAIEKKMSETVITLLSNKITPLENQYKNLKKYAEGDKGFSEKQESLTKYFKPETNLVICLSQPVDNGLTLIEKSFAAFSPDKTKPLDAIRTMIESSRKLDMDGHPYHWYEVIGLQNAIVSAAALSNTNGRSLLKDYVLHEEDYLSFDEQFSLLMNIIRLGQNDQAIQILQDNLHEYFNTRPEAYNQLLVKAISSNNHSALSCLLDKKGIALLNSDALLPICEDLIKNHKGHDSAYFFSKVFLASKSNDRTQDMLLNLAAQFKKPLIARFLLEQGANPNIANPENGMTATHWAAQNNLPGLLTHLNRHGADFLVLNHQEKSPAELNDLTPYTKLVINKIININQVHSVSSHTNKDKHAIANLAFRGGGAKGAAYPSSIIEAERHGLFNLDDIIGVSGASAGAITAALVAMGFSASQLDEIMDKTPMTAFMDADIGNEDILSKLKEAFRLLPEKFAPSILPTGVNALLGEIAAYRDKRVYDPLYKSAVAIFTEKGLFNGNYFTNWLSDQFVEKLRHTNLGKGLDDEALKHLALHLSFKNLEEATIIDGPQKGKKAFKDLRVVATDISRQSSVWFSAALTPNASVVDAVRASMSFPIAFKPHRYYEIYIDSEGRRQKRIPDEWKDIDLIDGGVMDNYPVRAFDEEDEVNPQTLGFYLATKEEKLEFEGQAKPKATPIKNGLDFLGKLIASLLGHQEYSLFRFGQDEDIDRTIFIDDTGMGALDFDANHETLEALKTNGRRGVQDFNDRLASQPGSAPLSLKTQQLLLKFGGENTTGDSIQLHRLHLSPLQIIKVYARCQIEDLPKLNHYINPNTRDENGNTPLHLVHALLNVEKKSENKEKLEELKKALLTNHANASSTNLEGKIPKDVLPDILTHNKDNKSISFERVFIRSKYRNRESWVAKKGKLKQKVKNQADQVDELNTKLNQQKEITVELERQLDEAKKYATQVGKLKTELNQQKEKVVKLEGRLEEAKKHATQVGELTTELDQQKEDIVELEGHLKEAENQAGQIKTLMAAHSQQNQKIIDIEKQLEETQLIKELYSKISKFSIAPILIDDINDLSKHQKVSTFVRTAIFYIETIKQDQWLNLYQGFMKDNYSTNNLDHILQQQSKVNLFDQQPKLINSLFDASNGTERVSLLHSIVHGFIQVTQFVFDKCFQGYLGLILQFGNVKEAMQNVPEADRSGKLAKMMQPISAFTRELGAIANPNTPVNESNISNNLQRQYQSTIAEYEKQYQQTWWVNSARRQQANKFFSTVKDVPVYQLFKQIRQLQKDILVNDEQNAKNSKGYSRLFDISQQLNIQVCADLLTKEQHSLQLKQMVVEHLNSQKIMVINALIKRMPKEQSELRAQLEKLLSLNDLNDIGTRETIKTMEESLPKHLRYFIPIIKGQYALYELEANQSDNAPVMVP